MRSTLQVAIVGAAETDRVGKLPDISHIELHAQAARNAIADCGIDKDEIDGLACADQSPVAVAQYLGITPSYLDGTMVGGCSFMLHLRHAAAAINQGLCKVVLITHGQSGRSRVGVQDFGRALPGSLGSQFEAPYGPTGAPSLLPMGVLRYMKDYGLTHEQLAMVPVVQREWAAKNPRAMMRDPIDVNDVLSSRFVAYPMHLLECCLVADGGGALIVTSADRARDFPTSPVYVLGTGESSETAMVSQMVDFTTSKAFRLSGAAAFKEAGITRSDVDHLMIYDAFAHLPILGLEDLGFVDRGDAGAFVAEGNTRPGGRLPLNTNGGGLSYTHTGMYGMFALQEGVRQLRGTAPAQVSDAEVSVVHGIGAAFGAAGTIVLTNRS